MKKAQIILLFVVFVVILMVLRFLKAFISAKRNRVNIDFDVKKNLLNVMETFILVLSVHLVFHNHLLPGLLSAGIGMTSVIALQDRYSAKVNGQKPRPLSEAVVNGIVYMVIIAIGFIISLFI